MIKFVTQGLGYAPPVTLTTNGSVLPVQEMTTMSIFQKVVMTILQPNFCFKRLFAVGYLTAL